MTHDEGEFDGTVGISQEGFDHAVNKIPRDQFGAYILSVVKESGNILDAVAENADECPDEVIEACERYAEKILAIEEWIA